MLILMGDYLISAQANNQFRYSIVMHIHNVEDYLREAVDSIINQDLNFKENIQLVLVDSDSVDNSMGIALDYQKKYPENILCLSCDSDLTADAYNLGLENSKGKYINFMRAIDYLSLDAISKVDNAFKKYDVGVAVLHVEYLDITKRYPLKFKFKDDEDIGEFVDLKKHNQFIQVDVATTFINRELIGDLKFSDKIYMFEALFINQVLIRDNKYALLKDSLYYSREELLENIIPSKEDIISSFDYFYEELISRAIEKYSAVPKFVQNTFLYYLQSLVKIADIEDLFTGSQLDSFWDRFVNILDYIGMNEIVRHETLNNGVKNFLIFVKNEEFHIEVRGRELEVKSKNDVLNSLHKRKIWFDIVEIKDGFLNISGSFTSTCDKKYISIEAIKSGNNIKTVYEAKEVEYPNTNRVTKCFLSIPWEFTYSFDFKIPIGTKESFSLYFRTIYHENDNFAVMDSEVICRYYVNLSEYGNYYRKDGHILLLKRNVFYLRPESYIRAIVYEFKVYMKVFLSNLPLIAKIKTILFRFVCFITYPFYKNRKIWLFSDRRTLSGDNGEHFFRYAMTRKDDVHKYFVIENNCEDYYRLKNIYGKHVVEFESFKHKLLYAHAKKLLQSQISPLTYNPLHEPRPRRFAGFGLAEVYFLQHGVNRYDMSSWMTKFDKNLSLILTVSDIDYNEFIGGNYNYDSSIVQELGYPRFDNLTNENLKKQIVIMPTWRNNIKTANQLLNSQYYKHFNGLLNNERLINHAKKTGYEIILKPHPLMYKFINVFNVNDYVKVDNVTKHHDILCDSALMITDYSSVAFDFVYLKKPVIYYQYGGGSDHHFDISTVFKDDGSMDFGEKIDNEERLIDRIIEYMDNGCKMEDIYQKRVDSFYKYLDKNNSKRVYDWIYEH